MQGNGQLVKSRQGEVQGRMFGRSDTGRDFVSFAARFDGRILVLEIN